LTKKTFGLQLLAVCALIVALSAPALNAADKLSADKAGTIGNPTGQIAFIRNGNVWIMNADGTGQEMVSEVTNADGSMSWAPDGRRIAFTRSGKVTVQGPDPNVGGFHKAYDIFIAYLDSAYANNRMWWTRLTEDLGSRDPYWSLDGSEIMFWKDMNANKANAGDPNYQVCSMAPDGSDLTILRKDWQNFADDFLTQPALGPDGKIAAVAMYERRPQGTVVLNRDRFMVSVDSLRVMATANARMVAPSWSPDGQWMAYIYNDMNAPGIYIASADMKTKYLVFTPPVGAYLYTAPPSFSPDSKWLTFATTDGSVWMCDITGNGARRLTPPGLDRNPAWSKPKK